LLPLRIKIRTTYILIKVPGDRASLRGGFLTVRKVNCLKYTIFSELLDMLMVLSVVIPFRMLTILAGIFPFLMLMVLAGIIPFQMLIILA